MSSNDGEAICNMFGDYFYSNIQERNYTHDFLSTMSMDESGVRSNDFISDICSVVVYRLLKQVDLNKTPGPDNIHPIFISKCTKCIISHYLYYLNVHLCQARCL